MAVSLLVSGAYYAQRFASDTGIIRNHLVAITKTPEFRSYENTAQLNRTAAYIFGVFENFADTTYYQEFNVKGTTYRNVIAVFGVKNSKRIVVGAHYDVHGRQEGADDNASGVTGLLELARMLHQIDVQYRIELVAYTLEEPPFFRTEQMGSFIHAKSLADYNTDVFGMISLEMIGYFSDERKSQKYPMKLLSLFYGNKGNYITLVRKFSSGKFARQFCRKFKAAKTIRTKKFKGPTSLPGVDWSDHLNYWQFGFSALMITDTAHNRNPNYHEPGDKLETLDIDRMSKVINATYYALLSMP